MKPLCDAPCLSQNHSPNCEGRTCLVERARKGEQPARELMFSKLYAPVLQQARILCRRNGDAEDLAQTALLLVFQRLGQLRESARLLGWTRRIVQNAHRMSTRHSKFAPAGFVEFRETSLANGTGWSEGPVENLATEEGWCVLREKIRRLPPGLRAVLDYRVFQGKTTRETAEKLRISVEAVRTRLARARRALEQQMNDRPEPPSQAIRGREFDRAIRETAAANALLLLGVHHLHGEPVTSGSRDLCQYSVYEMVDPVATRLLLNGARACLPVDIHRIDIAEAAHGWRLYIHDGSEPVRVLEAGKAGEAKYRVERAFQLLLRGKKS